MSGKKKLFLIDVMAMAFRSFYAFINRPLSTSNGFPTSAIYGSALILTKILREEKPDYMIFASDSPEKTFRHDFFPAYKAHRSAMPDALAQQIPILYQLIELLQVPILRLPKMEADDILASLVHKFATDNIHAYIVGRDKDFMQLVGSNVSLFAPTKDGGFETLGAKEIFGIMGCRPDQIVDYLSLLGDASDGVPGVKGIGKTSAAKLLATYDHLEGIYEHLGEISNKRQQDALREGKDDAYLARRLITLKADIPINLDIESAHCQSGAILHSPGLMELFARLEFSTLVKRLSSESGTTAEAPLIEKPKVIESNHNELEMRRYHLIQTEDALARFLEKIEQSSSIAFDTETSGLDIISDLPIGVSFTTEDHHSYYLPLLSKHLKQLSVEQVKDAIKRVFANPNQTKIAHNLKFDLQMLENLAIPIAGPLQDTMIMAFLSDPSSSSLGIDQLSLRYFGFKKISITELIGKKSEIPMSEVPLDRLYYYACEDTDVCMALALRLRPELKEKGLEPLFNDCEMPLVPILARMEKTGIYADGETLASLAERFSKERSELEAEVFQLAGTQFNLNSPKQLQEIIFGKLAIHEKLGLKRIKKTQNGFSTDASVLEQMREHPLVAKILDYRVVNKLQNTYVETLPQLIHEKTGRIHTSFHQCGAATGRFSSTNPNLQNIPIRSEKGREIRAAFAAEPGNVLVSADYSQIELRLVAHLSKDEGLLESFRNDRDIHRETAQKIFQKTAEEVTATDRSHAKAINFGIIYGMGPNRLASSTGVSITEAKTFIDQYFRAFPKIRNLIEMNIADAKAKGYSTTILGRRRPIAGLDGSLGGLVLANARNMAINSPIQGSAADLIKIAMVMIQRKLDASNLKAKMLLQVHDELVFECPEEEKEAVAALVKSAMESAFTLDVPLKVECGFGKNWLSAH